MRRSSAGRAGRAGRAGLAVLAALGPLAGCGYQFGTGLPERGVRTVALAVVGNETYRQRLEEARWRARGACDSCPAAARSC